MGGFIYGIHPVTEALKANKRLFTRVMISKKHYQNDIQKIVTLAELLKVPVEFQDERAFRRTFKNVVHQNVAAQVSALPLVDEGAILKKAAVEGALPLILAVDGVEDPQNLGSMVRSALAMGVHGILIPKTRVAPLSAAVSKASAGAMEHMFFARVSNLVGALNRLKEKGLWVVGSDARAGSPLDQTDLNLGLAIVVGGEDKGIRPLVRKTCDFMVSVPQSKRLDSLNVGVASAVLLYEVARQRRLS